MGYTIAITGKGGTGKTTVAGLLVFGMIRRGLSPVLAVDADPNSCVDGVLGVKVTKSVGGIREDVRENASEAAASGVSKREMLELKIAECLVEAEDFDLISMGRPEGPGCYCYANNVLRDVIQEISGNYSYTVIDNEAGLENLSRRIVQKVDLMVMVCDPSRRGMETAARIHALAAEMEIEYGRLALVVNRIRGAAPGSAQVLMKQTGAHFLVSLPDDEELARWGELGKSLKDLPDKNPVSHAVADFINQVFS